MLRHMVKYVVFVCVFAFFLQLTSKAGWTITASKMARRLNSQTFVHCFQLYELQPFTCSLIGFAISRYRYPVSGETFPPGSIWYPESLAISARVLASKKLGDKSGFFF